MTKEQILATTDEPTEKFIQIIDSTESDFSKSVKYINRKYWRFITECGTAVDLPNEVVKEQVARLAGLQKLVKLYQQLIALVKLLKGRK